MTFNKNKIKYIVSYSILIGWILSFVYDGTLLQNVMAANNIEAIFISLFISSVIGCVLFGFLKVFRKEFLNNLLLFLAISSSCFIYFLPQMSAEIQIVLFSFIAFSMTIICLRQLENLRLHIELKESFIVAGVVMLFANLISATSSLLISTISTDAAFIFITASIIVSFILLAKNTAVKKYDKNNAIVNSELIKIAVLIYLLKISEGMLYSNAPINYQISTFAYFYVLPYLIATVLIILILRSSRFYVLAQLIAFSICFIGVGSILFMLNSDVLNSAVIHFSFGFFDVIIWGIMISFCFVYSNYIKGISLILASHMLGILTGGILSNVVSPQNTVIIVIVFAFIAVLFLPSVNKFMFSDILNKQLEIDKHKRLLDKIRKKNNYNILTNREKEVLELIILRKKYADVARELHITETTVKTHIKHIFDKIGVQNKKELIEVFVEK